MKLTILGYWGGYPSQNGATSAYLVEDKGFTLLLDLGSASLMTYQKYKKISELDAVILSHYHADHIADVGVLQHGLIVEALLYEQNLQIPIYAHNLNHDAFQQLTSRHTQGLVYEENDILKIGPFTLKFLKTNHPVPCFAMQLTNGEQTIVYTADTAYQESLVPFSKHADLLLAEASLYDGQDGGELGHMTSKEAGRIAQKAHVKSLILTHLPHYGSHKQLLFDAQEIFHGSTQLAEEGLVWKV